jgi:hypothetical protein
VHIRLIFHTTFNYINSLTRPKIRYELTKDLNIQEIDEISRFGMGEKRKKSKRERNDRIMHHASWANYTHQQ